MLKVSGSKSARKVELETMDIIEPAPDAINDVEREYGQVQVFGSRF